MASLAIRPVGHRWCRRSVGSVFRSATLNKICRIPGSPPCGEGEGGGLLGNALCRTCLSDRTAVPPMRSQMFDVCAAPAGLVITPRSPPLCLCVTTYRNQIVSRSWDVFSRAFLITSPVLLSITHTRNLSISRARGISPGRVRILVLTGMGQERKSVLVVTRGKIG